MTARLWIIGPRGSGVRLVRDLCLAVTHGFRAWPDDVRAAHPLTRKADLLIARTLPDARQELSEIVRLIRGEREAEHFVIVVLRSQVAAARSVASDSLPVAGEAIDAGLKQLYRLMRASSLSSAGQSLVTYESLTSGYAPAVIVRTLRAIGLADFILQRPPAIEPPRDENLKHFVSSRKGVRHAE